MNRRTGPRRLRAAGRLARLKRQFREPETNIEAYRRRLRIDHHADAAEPIGHFLGEFQHEPNEPRTDAVALVGCSDGQPCQPKDRQRIGRQSLPLSVRQPFNYD